MFSDYYTKKNPCSVNTYMHVHLCCEKPYTYKETNKQTHSEGVAHPFPHLHVFWSHSTAHSAHQKRMRNTCTSGLKSQSLRLGSTVTEDFSAELALMSELQPWDLPMTLAGRLPSVQPPSSQPWPCSSPAPGQRSLFVQHLTQWAASQIRRLLCNLVILII